MMMMIKCCLNISDSRRGI